MPYPTAQYIELALKSNSIWPEDPVKQELARFQAELAAAAAADQWENLTGWAPFLSSGEVETRYFECGDHNGDLDLKSGLLSLSSVTIGETLQTRDYAPLLYRPSVKWPYTTIQRGFYRGGYGWQSGYPFGGAQRIAIAGVWGFCLSVPADVVLALQKRAVATMMDLIENEQSVASISQDGFSKGLDIVGVRTQKDIAETGDKDFNTLADNYKRVILG